MPYLELWLYTNLEEDSVDLAPLRLFLYYSSWNWKEDVYEDHGEDGYHHHRQSTQQSRNTPVYQSHCPLYHPSWLRIIKYFYVMDSLKIIQIIIYEQQSEIITFELALCEGSDQPKYVGNLISLVFAVNFLNS